MQYKKNIKGASDRVVVVVAKERIEESESEKGIILWYQSDEGNELRARGIVKGMESCVHRV